MLAIARSKIISRVYHCMRSNKENDRREPVDDYSTIVGSHQRTRVDIESLNDREWSWTAEQSILTNDHLQQAWRHVPLNGRPFFA